MLTNKVAVITGASSGIGAALARHLAEEGAFVVLAARRKNRLEQVVDHIRKAGGKALVVRCDVTVSEDAEELIHYAAQECGRIDILINNAGRGNFASVEDTSDAMIESIFAVNVFALWYTTRPALRYMKRQGSGHIINIASVAGKLGFGFNSAYVAAKHACVGFTHSLRLELAETGIHASVICPSSVLTEWAMVTEGGSMLPFFAESGPAATRIARERGVHLPGIEGVMTTEEVVRKILDCIYHPVAEVYTHRGSHEFAVLAAQSREKAEQQQIPAALAERTVYKTLRKTPKGEEPE